MATLSLSTRRVASPPAGEITYQAFLPSRFEVKAMRPSGRKRALDSTLGRRGELNRLVAAQVVEPDVRRRGPFLGIAIGAEEEDGAAVGGEAVAVVGGGGEQVAQGDVVLRR